MGNLDFLGKQEHETCKKINISYPGGEVTAEDLGGESLVTWPLLTPPRPPTSACPEPVGNHSGLFQGHRQHLWGDILLAFGENVLCLSVPRCVWPSGAILEEVLVCVLDRAW